MDTIDKRVEGGNTDRARMNANAKKGGYKENMDMRDHSSPKHVSASGQLEGQREIADQKGEHKPTGDGSYFAGRQMNRE
jgi:hypothetical protein